MRRVVALTAAIAVVGLTLGAPAVSAHEPSSYTLAWTHRGPVTYRFAAGFPDGALRDRVRDAAATWNALGTRAQLADAPEPVEVDPNSCPDAPAPNAVHWRSIDGRGRTRAQTRMCPYPGGLFTFQLVLDRAEPWYMGADEPEDDELDVLSVLTHEFGHAAGFSGPFADGHFDPDDELCAVGPKQHTMCPRIPLGTTHMRSLEAHDIHTFARANPSRAPCTTFAGHAVCGAIRDRYLAGYGGPPSSLGPPLTGDVVGPDGVGRSTDFRGGSLYWHPAAGVHPLHGRLREKWFAAGGPSGRLGYPMTEEAGTARGTGRYVHFVGGSIFAKNGGTPYAVVGPIRDKWATMRFELGFLEYPTSDTLAVADGLYSVFDGGRIYWSAATGAHEVHGRILRAYLRAGGPQGLGFPIADEQPSVVGRVGRFERGAIYVLNGSRATVVVPASGEPSV